MYYADIATLPDGQVLDLLRVGSRDEINMMRTVHYRPSWQFVSNDWASFPEGARMLSMRLDEVLREVSGHLPEYQNIDAVTQFKVHLEFEHRERTYEAAFLWKRGEGQSQWLAVPVDHIISGVGQILNKKVPIEGLSIAPLQETEDVSANSAPIFNDGCIADSDFLAVSRTSPFGTNGHLTGYHIAWVDFTGSCSCSNNCTSNCLAGVQNTMCDEVTGSVWTACHTFAQAFNASFTSKANAYDVGASCAAGFSCVEKACLFCLCSLSTQVEVSGVTVSFASGPADWSVNYPAHFTCPVCEVDLCGGECTPVLVSLQDERFELTGLEESILFDLDADGKQERLSWTAETSDDAFLALDRNHNGTIDDGSELFGDAAPQPSGGQRNGFRALAVFDEPGSGGDNDGLITAGDTAFGSLRLWLDTNHDGISQPEEMSTLKEAGITAIDLDYVTSERRDRHGNRFRFASMVHSGQQRRLAASDVILLVAAE